MLVTCLDCCAVGCNYVRDKHLNWVQVSSSICYVFQRWCRRCWRYRRRGICPVSQRQCCCLHSTSWPDALHKVWFTVVIWIWFLSRQDRCLSCGFLLYHLTIRLHLVDQLTVVYFSGASDSARGETGTEGRPSKRSARGAARPCSPDGASLLPTARYYFVHTCCMAGLLGFSFVTGFFTWVNIEVCVYNKMLSKFQCVEYTQQLMHLV